MILQATDIAATVEDALEEINRGVWNFQEATGLQVFLPESVTFQIQLVTEDGLNAVSREQTNTTPAVESESVSEEDPSTRTTVRTEPDKTSSSESEVEKNSESSSETHVDALNGTDRSGSDVRIEILEYEQ